MPPAAKPAAKANESADFRRRRLSLSDLDTTEFPAAASTTPAAKAGGRQRRLSMSPEMGVQKPKSQLPFLPENVGTYSCHGVEPGQRQGETHAKINQDRGCICHPFGERQAKGAKGAEALYKDQALFCVFDGHGAVGDKVSHYTLKNVAEILEDHPLLHEDPAEALKQTFVTVDTNLKRSTEIDAELSGTTAVVVLYRLEHDDSVTIYTANAGDSRAVLAHGKWDPTPHAPAYPNGKWLAKALDLSEDQKPDTPKEMSRIKKAGGFVSPPEEEWGGPARVWLDANMTLPGLAMARSIGDHLVADIGVVAEPEVKVEKIVFGKGDDVPLFIVMASDGVWEFIESQPAVDIVNKYIHADATDACTKLIETAAAKWRHEEGDYRDDITAICFRLPDLFTNAMAATEGK